MTRPSRCARWSPRPLAACTVLAAAWCSTQPAAAAQPARVWYGELTLLTDAGASTLLIASLAVNDRDSRRWLLLGSGAAYLVGAPVVHLTQDRAPTALGSLGLRFAAPALGGLLGAQLSGLAAYDDGNEVVIGTVLGVLGGVVTALSVDAALLAWKPAPAEPHAHPRRSWWPTLALSNEHAVLGAAGHF